MPIFISPVPAIILKEVEYTLDKPPAHHWGKNTDAELLMFTFTPVITFRITSFPDMHVVGLWEEAGVPRESPHRHNEGSASQLAHSHPGPSCFEAAVIITVPHDKIQPAKSEDSKTIFYIQSMFKYLKTELPDAQIILRPKASHLCGSLTVSPSTVNEHMITCMLQSTVLHQHLKRKCTRQLVFRYLALARVQVDNHV